MNTEQPKKRKSIVQFPERGKARCLEAICYGNDRIAGLLDYFIYGADLEAEHQKLEEGCKVVTFTRKHKDILEKLKFNISRKTLIRYLDLLDKWGYVSSATYSRIFTVNGDKIQEALANPPRKSPRKPRATKSCKVENESEQKVVDLSQENNPTTLQLLEIIQKLEQKVVDLEQKVESLQPSNVVDLQLKVVELQQMVVNLQQKVDILSTLQPSLSPLAESDEGHNFDPYSNNSNNHNITVINIPSNESTPSTIVADATTLSFSSSEEKLEQESFPVVNTATNESENTESGTTRNHLFDANPSVLVMPPETAKWCAETLVQIVEFKRNKQFLEEARGKSQKSQRQRQLDAAKKIIDAKITREEFVRAYDARNDAWWQENQGELTVVEMAVNTKNRVMRTIEVLESIEKKKGASRQQKAETQSTHGKASNDGYTKEERLALMRMTPEERKNYNQKRREARNAVAASDSCMSVYA